MKILISGSHGFIGAAVHASLRQQDHSLLRLIRLTQIAKSDEVFWNPVEGFIERGKLDGIDAVIHLAGENIFGRWNEKKKRAIRDSRVTNTAFLARTLAEMEQKPKTLICASAIGYYGNRDEHECIETAAAGSGFLSDVCKAWEAATAPAADAGIRVVNLRFGVVLGKEGGSLAKMLPAFKMGMGGPLGDGQQWVSWVSIDDAVRAVQFALDHETLAGPVNVVSPHPVRNKEFAHAIGHALHRPEVVPVPKRMLKFMFGDFAEETLLASTRVLPHKLQMEEFQFDHPDLHTALEAIFQ
ncbi:MAG: TIGR01777 family oxidoreductase [Planctomycetota bacterium]